MIPTKLKKSVTIFKRDNSVVNLGHCHDNTKPCNFFLPFFPLCVCVCVLYSASNILFL